MHRISAVFAAIVGCVLSASALAGTITFAGTTAGGPTWNRPVAGNPPTPPLSGVGTTARYAVDELQVSLNGTYTFQETATSPAGWDDYTFLYRDDFNPLSQFTNVLIGNDDNPTVGLSGFGLNLTAGIDYFLVSTGFANTDFGDFSETVSGPGEIHHGAPAVTVPEPTSLALVGLGLTAFIASRRRARSA